MPFRVARTKNRSRANNGQMNKTEERYYERLQLRQRAGEIAEIWYEGITLKLAQDCRYTPDFLVQLASGDMECHEVKGGFIRDDARVKIKVAARLYPFRFILAQEIKKTWTITVIGEKCAVIGERRAE